MIRIQKIIVTVQYSFILAMKVTLSYSLRIPGLCGKLQSNITHYWVNVYDCIVKFSLLITLNNYFADKITVFAEHRYYGKSLPFGNKSFTSPEFSGYLTSEQALADYAHLLVNQVNPNNRPVIAFGGSYGGMLSAWFRMKYPHLVTGAIAASAPVLQFTSDCNRFNTILTSVFTVGQGNCSRNIRLSWDILK